ncbi:glycoside hydrolase family 32 protein [Pseudactinotalea suaedae]|uniref:glycoside hydrolase family 32 protein n=1 Tax=Pseudactinotalea suaedae TaxID=1524924 RepID=UPI001390ABC6|nr:glycoside hydrolase family 32 protein [Pseudactinotalea suaedae]
MTDPAFPALHGRPPTGWINDPNGCSRVDGTWHVYYQHNPGAPVHTDIHWGHMSSPDLLRWTTEPIALAPRPDGPDAGGCWSGCLVDDDGVPTAVYTGVDDDRRPSTVLARTDREARVFTRDEPPVAGLPRDPAITDVRDPFVFSFRGHRWAVQGAGAPGGVGEVLLYSCDDLTSWHEIGTLLRSDHALLADVAAAEIWECPSLVQVGDDWVLVVSLWRHVDGTHQLYGVSWILGDLTGDGDAPPSFSPRAAGRLDAGDAFYAPQALAIDGRVLLWGWSWETDHGSERLAAAPWQGVLTYPRELDVVENRVVSHPAAELTGLRAGSADPDRLPNAFEVVIPEGGTVALTLDGTACWPQGLAASRVFVDGSLVEVFLHDGTTLTTRAYPTSGSRWQLTGDLSGVQIHALGV